MTIRICNHCQSTDLDLSNIKPVEQTEFPQCDVCGRFVKFNHVDYIEINVPLFSHLKMGNDNAHFIEITETPDHQFLIYHVADSPIHQFNHVVGEFDNRETAISKAKTYRHDYIHGTIRDIPKHLTVNF